MRFLRQNTATRITVGPFVDVTDAKTPEVALTATNEKITFVVDDAGVPTLVIDANATASGGNNDMVHITGDDAGYYDLELTATQTNYVGRATLSINYVTDHLPVFHEFMIVPAVVYDAFFGTARLPVDLDTIKTQTVTAGAGVTILASVGTASTSTAQTGDSYARLGAPAGASVSADIAAVKTDTAAILTDTADMQPKIGTPVTSLAADIAAIEAQTDDIGAAGAGLTAIPWNAAWDAEVQSEVADALAVYDPPTNAEMEARTLVAADYATATNLATVDTVVDDIKLYASRTVVRGTVGTSTTPSATQFTPSALSPSGASTNQFQGRIIVFDNDTTSTGLRGVATDITASSNATLPLLTFSALPSAPVNGDTFSIV